MVNSAAGFTLAKRHKLSPAWMLVPDAYASMHGERYSEAGSICVRDNSQSRVPARWFSLRIRLDCCGPVEPCVLFCKGEHPDRTAPPLSPKTVLSHCRRFASGI